jgi:3-isopropylmalate dehydratase large subunit
MRTAEAQSRIRSYPFFDIDMPGSTVCEKILARASGEESVKPGDIIDAKPDFAMSHDNTYLVHCAFREAGATRVADPSSIVVVIDHRAPANSVNSANTQSAIRKIVGELEIDWFFDVGSGICHQLLVEKGIAKPGTLILGADSHSTTFGAVGAMGVGVGATDMASVWVKGSIWLKVPETIKMNLEGRLRKGVFAKDLSLAMVGELGAMGADYCCLEFHGDWTAGASVSERMTLCNMAAETGAKSALVPESPVSDPGARYSREARIDAGNLEPMISIPHSVDKVAPVASAEGTEVSQAFLGSCTNGRLDDLAIAASILSGRKVSEGTRLIVTPASSQVYLEAVESGIIGALMRAGAVVTACGCGPCLGAHQGVLADKEVCISSSNRNFRGRMGSRDASIYLASPATVAASAIEGRIADPRRYVK